MNRFLMFLMLMIYYVGAYANGNFGLKLEIRAEREMSILGEPFECEIIFRNTGQEEVKIPFSPDYMNPYFKLNIKGEGYKKECCFICAETGMQIPHSTTLKKGEEVKWKEDLSERGARGAGEYEVWFELDSTMKENESMKIKLESNHIKFRIIKPSGKDLE
ncbi:MAG: hypothetical protein N2445_04215, partial [Acidobacteria bacterium]|nr:hypothetical protein [Acidobacteriota bacterium]